ncbi:MAG: amino acid ABC transporter ATP-binding protein [Roseiflexus sp.]|jgi:polar amino acid transport system ATP-binding protein|nr:amino acid ABC transporter ATP-binding protein [Roseiflexus sp.]MBO9336615.1 amino acid ABC transporter ATP-binding protein [Roseiflexus sp.]MBO9366203.1 amino acid ABC transporter ATP-binding protein [Roseiflexus sp.]MBO9381200.1 amino acid ABC transporter ATP-binding protein [Roseiflexus sp.]MBO9388130.1 amino acid ABC transporter ATP-binding protein [Roseiflexus sp.]
MTAPILRIEDVHKSYGNLQVLKGVSLTVQPQEVVVLVGPSGSGKSTLLRCINLLSPPTKGRIWLEDQDITAPGVNQDRVRQRIGMVFQEFNLFTHLTALGNVMIGLTKVRKMRKNEARDLAMFELERVGLADRAHYYPAQLSGGQKQRVAIARALSMDPHIMLFDEPTSALDPELTGEVLAVMQKLASEGMTMIVVSHEIGFARQVADRVVFMEGGVVVEEGPPQCMFKQAIHERTRAFLRTIEYMRHAP